MFRDKDAEEELERLEAELLEDDENTEEMEGPDSDDDALL